MSLQEFRISSWILSSTHEIYQDLTLLKFRYSLTRNRVLFLLSIILDLQEKHLLFRKDQGNSMKIINSKKSECYYRSSLETKEII